MQIQNQFEVAASPDRVYAFLLDVNRVVTCMPGAELSEVVDPTTFKGRVRIKVGPITVSYNGTARITDRDDAARVATLQADGRETTGPGSARATAKMSVDAAENGRSTVRLDTDFTVAGRIANFGRGVMEDVSKRLVSQMADCIKANLESEAPADTAAPQAPQGETSAAAPADVATGTPAQGSASPDAAAAPAGPAPAAQAPAGAPAPARSAAPPAAAAPVNAFGLFFAVLWDRIRRLFGGR
jgi:carbon monoxide dehydrogenase subunit G